MPKEIRVSTYIAPLTRLGTPELVVDALKEAGFKYYDFTMMFSILGFDLFFDSDDYLVKAQNFRKYTDRIGIFCNQTHGSIPCIKKGMSAKEKVVLFDKVKRTIEISSILGAEYCVLHPASDCSMEDNIQFFSSLKDIAKQNKIIIAIENTLSDKLFGKPDDFVELLSGINDDSFKVCLDVGHAETKNTGSSAIEFIEKLKKKIVCLHIHDNDKNEDMHQLPYTLVIDFESIFKALKDNGYSGDITFECGSYFNNMPTSLFVDALKFLRKLGEYIGKQIYK